MNKKTQAIAILLGGLLFIALVVRASGNANGKCLTCMPENSIIKK
ncbi:MAG TPA: hypothetical protein VHM26_18025 [Chitinophagaceae bacterium]|jgi:hypothetical protein|nr:hypothetical protein [Chitinophagaceae bacterium]